MDYGKDELGVFARKSCHLGEVNAELFGALEELSSWEWPVYQQYGFDSLFSPAGCERGTGKALFLSLSLVNHSPDAPVFLCDRTGKYFPKSGTKKKRYLSGQVKSTKLKLKIPRYNGVQYDDQKQEEMKVLEWDACQLTPLDSRHTRDDEIRWEAGEEILVNYDPNVRNYIFPKQPAYFDYDLDYEYLEVC